MDYAMSKLEIDSDIPGERQTPIQRHHQQLSSLDHEIAHQTKFRSAPCEMIRKVTLSKQKNMPISTVLMLSAREANYSGMGRFSKADSCHVLSRYLPVHGPWLVDGMNSKAYVSQFSPDGTLFVAGFQGSHIRIYNVDNGWKLQKDIIARSLRWTITDTSLSPDQRYLVYSSLSPTVHIVNVRGASTESYGNINEIHDGLDFSINDDDDKFGIFSVKFSSDGRELVAGTDYKDIYVYDLEANKVALKISAHSSDVNTVSFADETGHVIYSGSDDGLCKVWDRRCLNAGGRPSGVLTGHLEGITYLDSRGDGRYFISNGKDQTTKLWDIRKMSSNVNWSLRSEWDYRWNEYPDYLRDLKHPHDQSLATYRGHLVLRTLIRCYFSPAYRIDGSVQLLHLCDTKTISYSEKHWSSAFLTPNHYQHQSPITMWSEEVEKQHRILEILRRITHRVNILTSDLGTGQKYIYTGSHDSNVYIYDVVTGAQVAKLEYHDMPVRDCSWHPFYPMLVSSSWDGTIVRWEFPGKSEVPTLAQKKI